MKVGENEIPPGCFCIVLILRWMKDLKCFSETDSSVRSGRRTRALRPKLGTQQSRG